MAVVLVLLLLLWWWLFVVVDDGDGAEVGVDKLFLFVMVANGDEVALTSAVFAWDDRTRLELSILDSCTLSL